MRSRGSSWSSLRSLALGLVLLATMTMAMTIAGCRTKTPATILVAKRVVSISANTTETLFAVGAGDRVVGRSRYCDFPQAALALPIVGGYVDPNLEAVLALRPDLVVGARGPLGPGFVRALEEHGIATYFPDTERFDDIVTMIEGIGARTDHVDGAAQLVASMRARRDQIARAVASLPRPRVLLLFSSKPVSAAGNGSFPDEMLTLAGATNVVQSGGRYPTLSLENVIALDPDVILRAEMGSAAAPLDEPWSTVRAVREKKVVVLEDETILRPGPRLFDGVATLARTVHPGLAL